MLGCTRAVGDDMVGVVLLSVLSCSNDVALSNEELITRLSLDLRGIRPSIEELDEARKRSWSVEFTVDDFLRHPSFPRVSAERWAKILDTRQDETLYPASDLGLNEEFRFAYSVGDEPLRVMEAIIRRNLPWSTVVQADWTMLNTDLQSVYPAQWIADPPQGDDWALARYVDGRPSAGVLVGNGLWWRYDTSLNNASRQRANQVSRIFLCRDYLDLPVSFDSSVDLTTEEGTQSAIQEHPGCVACHATLDPLAAFMGGVFARNKSDPEEFLFYHPEREGLVANHLGVTPMWNGVEGEHLGDLGDLIASDPAFATCATRQIAESLLGSGVPDAFIDEHTQLFENGFALSMGRLIREMVLSDVYKERWSGAEVPWKTVSLTQLESQVFALTGYTLQTEGYPLLRADSVGFASMVDEGMSMPLVLIQQELAHVAGRYWFLESDIVPFDITTVEQPTKRIRTLGRMILGVEPTKQELEDWVQYIDLLQSEFPANEVWASIATVMMQDPRFLVY